MPARNARPDLRPVPRAVRGARTRRPRYPASTRHTVARPKLVNLVVTLPRAPWTVALARRLARTVLHGPHVGEECRTAVEIALCEACTNAVRHGAPATHYELHLRVTDHDCTVEVTDAGAGFDYDAPPAMPAALALSGRGLAIIARVTDRLDILRRQPTGTIVRFAKRLS